MLGSPGALFQLMKPGHRIFGFGSLAKLWIPLNPAGLQGEKRSLNYFFPWSYTTHSESQFFRELFKKTHPDTGGASK